MLFEILFTFNYVGGDIKRSSISGQKCVYLCSYFQWRLQIYLNLQNNCQRGLLMNNDCVYLTQNGNFTNGWTPLHNSQKPSEIFSPINWVCSRFLTSHVIFTPVTEAGTVCESYSYSNKKCWIITRFISFTFSLCHLKMYLIVFVF